MTALLLAAAFACGAALPAMAEQATPETAAQPDPTEWADEAQDVTEAEEAPVYQQADAQEVATGETAASLTVTAADCTAQFIDEAYRLFLPVNTDMAALTIETGAELAAADAEGLTVDGTTVSGDFTNIETLNLTFTDGKAARVELYKSQLPSVSFTLNGVTLDEIQAGSKDVKYKGNSVTISQAGGSDLTDTDVEFKGRGKHYWYVDGERQGLQKGGLEFTDPDTGCRYWLDPDDSGARAENRKVQLDEDRLCYFDENGCMAFGECLEHGGWYYYDEKTGAQCRGPVVLPDGRQVFYSLTNGKMLYGKQTICGTSFTFNTVNGSRSSGPDGLFWLEWGGKRYWFESWKRQGYNPYDSSYRGKEIYDPASDAWYWLDNIQNGAMAASKDVYQESNGGKWVRYDENGHMVKGWDVNENGTYYFDQITGAMAKGALLLDDVQYGFDPIMGTMLDCQWLHTEVGDYWYEGGIRQGTEGRGKEIYDLASDAWYWLDAVDNGKKAVSKDVYQESDGGKWVRYDADGHMIKGWDTQGVDRFYFDPVTGAMAKGVVMIDGIRYWFDSRTGALIAPK